MKSINALVQHPIESIKLAHSLFGHCGMSVKTFSEAS